MGVFQDLLDNAKTFKSTSQLASFIQAKINSQLDPGASAAAAATNAVHTIATSTQTSGNMTLTVTLRNGETFTTGSILFSATAATIETAIDSAATTASITGWTNGDITVTGGAVNVAPVVLTFDGASVSGANHVLTVLNDVDGAGGAWGAVTLTTAGQTVRRALDVLIALGALDDGTIPVQSLSQASNSAVVAGANIEKLPQWALRCLARELAEEDGNNDIYHSVIESLSIQDKARKAQRLGESSEVA
jgi:hypothetical protein